MRHAILGNGNLGNALTKEIISIGHEFKIFSASTGWCYPKNNIQKINEYHPDHVWITVGAGSIEQAQKDYLPFLDLHVKLPMELVQQLPASVTLHLFSTDYCFGDIKSLYALSKKHMEDAVVMTGRERTYIYRVGSLYGFTKPEVCFPYKLKKVSLTNKIILPLNCISPTPVDWLAKVLIKSITNTELKVLPLCPTFISPRECTTTKMWGEMILGLDVGQGGDRKGFDRSRPTICNHYQPVTIPTWLTLWQEREDEWKQLLQDAFPS